MAARTAARASQPERQRRRLSPVPSLLMIGVLLIMLGAADGSGVPFTLGCLSILTAALVAVTR